MKIQLLALLAPFKKSDRITKEIQVERVRTGQEPIDPAFLEELHHQAKLQTLMLVFDMINGMSAESMDEFEKDVMPHLTPEMARQCMIKLAVKRQAMQRYAM